MYKIIYVNIDLGYKVKKIPKYSTVLEQQIKLTNAGGYVICVFDDVQKSFVFKAVDYDFYKSFVLECLNLNSSDLYSTKALGA